MFSLMKYIMNETIKKYKNTTLKINYLEFF